MERLQASIRSIPNWPIDGVIFRDLTTLMQNPQAFKETCDLFHNRYKNLPIDKIVGIDARGFVFGAVLAYHLAFVVELPDLKGRDKIKNQKVYSMVTFEGE